MNEPTSEPMSHREEDILQRVLQDSGGILSDSLRNEERRRRRRRFISWSLVVGGVMMSALLIAFLAGWLVLASPPQTGGKDKDSAQALFQEGAQLWQGGNPSKAIPKFEEAVESDPSLASAWNGLGWCRFNTGLQIEAEEAFLKCVELQPRHPAAQNGLGQLYVLWREYDKAEKHLKVASSQAPASWFGLARMYMLTGDYHEAEKWIRKCLTQQPGDADLKQLLAEAKAKKLGEEMKAKIEGPGKPTSPEATAGWRHFNHGDMSSAEKEFRAALAKDPENGGALNGLGFCLLNSGSAAEAQTYFEKCLKLEPKAAGAMNGLARCLKADGKVKEAIALWEKMAEANPGVNTATVGLAQALIEEGEFAKALPYCQQLVDSDPKNPEWQQLLQNAQAGQKASEKE